MAILKDWKKKQKNYLILGFITMQPKQLVSNEQNEYLQPTKLVNGYYMYRKK